MTRRTARAWLVASIATLGCCGVLAQQTAAPADNTRNNQANHSSPTAIADDQKQDSGDIKLTQQIRRSVMANKSLSTYAHNVKIVTVNGNVTLNGVVRSEDEKAVIQQEAESVAGADHVVNQLNVQPRH
jgi:hyperosmotically inducible protein